MTCRVRHPDAAGLGDLVAEPFAFLAQDVFRRIVFTPAGRAESSRAGDFECAAFPTAERLWADALARHVRTPGFRLVREGATLPASSYCRAAGVGHRTIDDVIEANRVIELHRAGATMVLQGLQLSDPDLGRFANNLALDLDHPVQVNAYLSPAAARGLDVHFDFHDVFVVQLDGRKRWRAWEPLARMRNPVRGGTQPTMPTLDQLGRPSLDLELGAGDCLYIPRGYPHAAETVDAASAHLTVGVMAVTWQRVMRHALDAAAISAGDIRASVAVRSLDAWPDDTPAEDRLAPVAAELGSDHLRAWLAAEVWRRQPVTRLRPLTPVAVQLDRPVAVTPGPLLWASLPVGGSRAVLGLGDRRLDHPAAAFELLAALLRSPRSFVVAEWHGALDDSSRQVVLDRLADEGVIVPGTV